MLEGQVRPNNLNKRISNISAALSSGSFSTRNGSKMPNKNTQIGGSAVGSRNSLYQKYLRAKVSPDQRQPNLLQSTIVQSVPLSRQQTSRLRQNSKKRGLVSSQLVLQKDARSSSTKLQSTGMGSKSSRPTTTKSIVQLKSSKNKSKQLL